MLLGYCLGSILKFCLFSITNDLNSQLFRSPMGITLIYLICLPNFEINSIQELAFLFGIKQEASVHENEIHPIQSREPRKLNKSAHKSHAGMGHESLEANARKNVHIVEFLRALGSQSLVSVWQHIYSGKPVVARSFIASGSSSIALLSCSADVLFILGTWYLNLRALRLHTG